MRFFSIDQTSKADDDSVNKVKKIAKSEKKKTTKTKSKELQPDKEDGEIERFKEAN